MLILLSFTDSLSFAFISNRLSVWLTCLNKGEQDPRPVPQKEMIKEGGRERERDPPTGSSAPQQTTHTHSFTPFFVVNVFISSLFYPLFFFLPISFLQDFLLLVRSMITPKHLMHECVTCLLPTWHCETGNRRVLSLNWPYETHHRVPRQYKICSIMYCVHLQNMPIILVTVMHTQQQNKLSQFVWFNRQYKTTRRMVDFCLQQHEILI